MISMAQTITEQIGRLQGLDVANAANLLAAVQAAHAFDATRSSLMATAINQQVVYTTRGAAKGPSTQTIKDVRSYFTPSDWEVFEDPKLTLNQKVNAGADRMMLLGVKNPTEATVKSIAAAIASAHFPSAAPGALHGLVIDVKLAMHARRNHDTGTGQHIFRYPDDPRNLSQEMLAVAYPSDQPVRKEIAVYSVLMNKIPLRKTNQQLSHAGVHPATLGHPLSSGSSSSAQAAQLNN